MPFTHRIRYVLDTFHDAQRYVDQYVVDNDINVMLCTDPCLEMALLPKPVMLDTDITDVMVTRIVIEAKRWAQTWRDHVHYMDFDGRKQLWADHGFDVSPPGGYKPPSAFRDLKLTHNVLRENGYSNQKIKRMPLSMKKAMAHRLQIVDLTVHAECAIGWNEEAKTIALWKSAPPSFWPHVFEQMLDGVIRQQHGTV